MISAKSLEISAFVLLCLWANLATAQSQPGLNLRGMIAAEVRSNVARQPGFERDNDIRLNLILNLEKDWRWKNRNNLIFSYGLQHFRYGEFHTFTRYDHTLRAQYARNLGSKYKLGVFDEFRFRYHPAATQFSYRRNIIDLGLSRTIGLHDRLTIGYQHWLKSYDNDASLDQYLSHRASVRFSHEINQRTNLGAWVEYQYHGGNLYAGSTAPEQPLNVTGNRLTFRLNLDKIFDPRFVASMSYKYEFDVADDFDIQNAPPVDDEEGDEFVAEDSDYGFGKHLGSVSVLYKANKKVTLLFFYLVYFKRFDYWRIVPGGLLRHDTALFFSNKVCIMLSNKLDLNIRHIFEANETNLKPYKYQIHSISVGLDVTP